MQRVHEREEKCDKADNIFVSVSVLVKKCPLPEHG